MTSFGLSRYRPKRKPRSSRSRLYVSTIDLPLASFGVETHTGLGDEAAPGRSGSNYSVGQGRIAGPATTGNSTDPGKSLGSFPAPLAWPHPPSKRANTTGAQP